MGNLLMGPLTVTRPASGPSAKWECIYMRNMQNINFCLYCILSSYCMPTVLHIVVANFCILSPCFSIFFSAFFLHIYIYICLLTAYKLECIFITYFCIFSCITYICAYLCTLSALFYIYLHFFCI